MKRAYVKEITIYLLVSMILALTIIFTTEKYSFFPKIGESIGVSIITLAIFTFGVNILQKNFLENKISDIIENKNPLMSKLYKVGLTEWNDEFNLKNNDIKNAFIHDKEITLVFNDGQRFFRNNIELFKERFSKKLITNMIIMDPDCTDSLSVLTRKNGYEDKPDYYFNKINNFIDEVYKEGHKFKDHKIRIYTHNLFNTMSVIVLNKYIMFSLYRISPGKTSVPHITIEKTNDNENSEYIKIKSDIETLLKSSVLKKNKYSLL